jgi:hypothetical protein
MKIKFFNPSKRIASFAIAIIMTGQLTALISNNLKIDDAKMPTSKIDIGIEEDKSINKKRKVKSLKISNVSSNRID